MKRTFLILLRYLVAKREEKLNLDIRIEDFSYIFEIDVNHDYTNELESIYEQFANQIVEKFVDGNVFDFQSDVGRIDLEVEVDRNNQSFQVFASEYVNTEDYYESNGEIENNEDLKEFFNEKNLQEVNAIYYGGGDSGSIEEFSTNCPSSVEDVFFTLLEENYGGWEINEGSRGTITITKDPSEENVFNYVIEHTWFNEEYVSVSGNNGPYTINDL